MRAAVLEPRALCDRCFRPPRVCVCARLPHLAPRTRVVVLQHPRERRMPIGTARMAARCLEGSTVIVGTALDGHPAVASALADLSRPPALLWPGPGALPLETAAFRGPITLVVVDGTWSTAKKLLKLNPGIAALPRYALSPEAPGEYRIRREPRAECLSTIEAIASALGVLEGDPSAYRAMLDPFRAMVDAQLVHIATGSKPRDRSRLARKRHRPFTVPASVADPARTVVVAVEANAWPAHEKADVPDELVQWLAVRGDGSERVDVLVRPAHPLGPSVASHTELASDVLLAAAPRDALPAAVRAFLRPGDGIATWGTYATRMMAAASLAPEVPHVNLRRAIADRRHLSPGSIDRCVESLGVLAPALGRGRGGRRLGLMLAVYRALLAPEGPAVP